MLMQTAFVMILTPVSERMMRAMCVTVLGPFTNVVAMTFLKVTVIVMAISSMPLEFVEAAAPPM